MKNSSFQNRFLGDPEATWKKKALWFRGEWYTKGDTVKNESDNLSYDLTASELSIYDFILGCCVTNYDDDFKPYNEINSKLDSNQQCDLLLSLRWFEKKNSKVYTGLGLDKIFNQFVTLGLYNPETSMFTPSDKN
jgi:hypothetical protein